MEETKAAGGEGLDELVDPRSVLPRFGAGDMGPGGAVTAGRELGSGMTRIERGWEIEGGGGGGGAAARWSTRWERLLTAYPLCRVQIGQKFCEKTPRAVVLHRLHRLTLLAADRGDGLGRAW